VDLQLLSPEIQINPPPTRQSFPLDPQERPDSLLSDGFFQDEQARYPTNLASSSAIVTTAQALGHQHDDRCCVHALCALPVPQANAISPLPPPSGLQGTPVFPEASNLGLARTPRPPPWLDFSSLSQSSPVASAVQPPHPSTLVDLAPSLAESFQEWVDRLGITGRPGNDPSTTVLLPLHPDPSPSMLTSPSSSTISSSPTYVSPSLGDGDPWSGSQGLDTHSSIWEVHSTALTIPGVQQSIGPDRRKECSRCGVRTLKLKRHMETSESCRNGQGPLPEKLKCEWCGNLFPARSDNLKRHKTTCKSRQSLAE